MDNSFEIYFEKLEMLAFFSGYPLVYFLILTIAGNKKTGSAFKSKIVSLLPLAYALTGTLYLGLQLKNLYPDYSFENINASFQFPLFKIWGILACGFWLPVLRKRAVISLLHSFAFFFLIIRDFYFQLSQADTDKHVLKNEMNVYIDSILMNISTLALIGFTYFFILYFKKIKNISGIS